MSFKKSHICKEICHLNLKAKSTDAANLRINKLSSKSFASQVLMCKVDEVTHPSSMSLSEYQRAEVSNGRKIVFIKNSCVHKNNMFNGSSVKVQIYFREGMNVAIIIWSR